MHNVLISDKRVFFSEVRDTNELGTLVKKLEILMISLNVRSYFICSQLLFVVSAFGNSVY